MLRSGLYTLRADERGESALQLLPAPAAPDQFVLVHGKNLRESDAFTGTALKTAVQYHCACLHNTFGLEPPEGPGSEQALEMLADLMGQMPKGFYLTDGAALTGTTRGNALLPALSVEDPVDAANAADVVALRTRAYGMPVARTVGAAVAIFADNAMTHAPESPVGVVTTVAFSPSVDSVQVVSSDLGRPVEDPADGEQFLRDLHQAAAASHSNLGHLLEAAERRGVTCTLTLAAGAGRLSWTSSGVASDTSFEIPGFTAALTVEVGRAGPRAG
jgi:hypothetical protein